jgi:cholesterol oxidase
MTQGSVRENNQSQWLSKNVEVLFHELSSSAVSGLATPPIDVLILGSGYGGSVAAEHFSRQTKADGTKLRVVVIERGKEYLPGSFPSRFADLAGHVRMSTPQLTEPKGNLEGLFDLRIGADVSVLVGNGVGGGSLINAGVMLKPSEKVLADKRWPTAFKKDSSFSALYDEARELLGAAKGAQLNRVDPSIQKFDKYVAFSKLAVNAPFSAVPIQVTLADTDYDGVKLKACIACGDCATGCNYQAKKSFDTTLLAAARRRGVEIYTGGSALSLRKGGSGGWLVEVAFTDKVLRKRETIKDGDDGIPRFVEVPAAKVILGAGSMGSTEILQRSTSPTLRFSEQLGKNFSSNGDMIAAVYGQKSKVNAVASEVLSPENRSIGPTITSMIDLRDNADSIILQEMAVPGALRRIFEEAVTTGDFLNSLSEGDSSEHIDTENDLEKLDPFAVNPEKIMHTSVVALMGDDGAGGEIETSIASLAIKAEGVASINWPDHKSNKLFDAEVRALEDLARKSGERGRVLPNPLWQLLPPSLGFLVPGGGKGSTLTVHPLGGCIVGNSIADGVVNDRGQVFNGVDGKPFDGLCVLDGAIVPTALSVNPGLTIATMALRAVRLLSEEWGHKSKDVPLGSSVERPRYKSAEQLKIDYFKVPPIETEIEIVERLSGAVSLSLKSPPPPDGVKAGEDFIVEISLRFKSVAIKKLMTTLQRKLDVVEDSSVADPYLLSPAKSTLRIFKRSDWEKLSIRRADAALGKPSQTDVATEEKLNAAAILIAPLSGHMRFFHQEASGEFRRVLRALSAWASNRGVRDITQLVYDPYGDSTSGTGFNLGSLKRIASRAGEVRLFDYDLTIGESTFIHEKWKNYVSKSDFFKKKISGKKRLTYSKKGNPWRQLTELELSSFPFLKSSQSGARPVLKMQLRYLANQGVPLLRLTKQQDQPSSLADLGSFILYSLRVMISVHLWTFRKPDAGPKHTPRRLAQPLEGLESKQHWLTVGTMPDGSGDPVKALVTQYLPLQENTSLAPIVVFHGYSASGSTFAHPALPFSFAREICATGRQAWIVDLRTSSGMDKTAKLPWSYEEVAKADVPIIINYVVAQAGGRKVDVVAHCIGAVMFSMAILDPKSQDDGLHTKVRKVVLLNKAPVLRYSQGNVLRSYIWRYYQEFFGMEGYQFTDAEGPQLGYALLDRLLSSMPYPEEEFELENPPILDSLHRTPFTKTRHRIDLLYGRTFSLKNLSQPVLDNIDDFFGPLSIETVTQTLHFATNNVVTTFEGKNNYVNIAGLKRYWTFPTYVIAGEENGLADPSTLTLVDSILSSEAALNVRTECIAGVGHQDALIGQTANRTYSKILKFLDEDDSAGAQASKKNSAVYSAAFPVTGPRKVYTGKNSEIRLCFGSDAGRMFASYVALIPVKLEKGKEPEFLMDYILWPKPTLIGDRTYFLDKSQIPKLASATGQGSHFALVLVYADPLKLGINPDQKDPASGGDDVFESDARNAPPSDEMQRVLESINVLLKNPEMDQVLAGAFPIEVEPNVDRFRLLVASCQYPAGMLEAKLAYASMRKVSAWLDKEDRKEWPNLAIWCGDQVYVDATAGVFDPLTKQNKFQRPYLTWLRSRAVRSVLSRVPSIHILDDHELNDNWQPAKQAPLGKVPPETLQYRKGVAAFLEHQRGVAPPFSVTANTVKLWNDKLEIDGFSLFIADIRTERGSRDSSNVASASIMSDLQMAALKTWFVTQADIDRSKPAFLASGSIFLPRRLQTIESFKGVPTAALRSDAWEGYPSSFTQVVGALFASNHQHIVFLSGDEHFPCDSEITIKGKFEGADRVVRCRSIHSSALHAPYPFANGEPAAMAAKETFSLGTDYGELTIDVSTKFFPEFREGYGIIDVTKQADGSWSVDARMVDAHNFYPDMNN